MLRHVGNDEACSCRAAPEEQGQVSLILGGGVHGIWSSCVVRVQVSERVTFQESGPMR